MPELQAVPLGAGQDVGRSCILVTVGGRNVMLDCGMHMGYQDDRRFPDFTYVNRTGGSLDEYIDCVIISHFHLDHSGALPYMSELVGYTGPIYMTYPTKAIVPVLLEDYRKIQTEFRGDKNFYTSNDIKNCMKKVVAVNLHETVQVDGELELRAFYAGHVLGAAVFEVRCGSESVVYTGDFNTTPDRHLGCASVPRGLKPDLLITESTYASTIRDSKRLREKDFLEKIHECVTQRQGKVLIPVFALGRAQELCILVESYWERTGLTVPIYISRGLAERANSYYKLFINWTNEKIKKTFVQRNMFHFAHIQPFDPAVAEMPGPCVIFATPGMLHSGQSLRVFKALAPDAKNMIVMPGYCVQGTIGHKVINGAKTVDIDGRPVQVKLGVEYMSFSAHADAHGILQLIHDTKPSNVMFVHGEKGKMAFLKEKVEQDCRVPVYMPENGETVTVKTRLDVRVHVPRRILLEALRAKVAPALCKSAPLNGFIVGDRRFACGVRVASRSEAARLAGTVAHRLGFHAVVPLTVDDREAAAELAGQWRPHTGQALFDHLLEWLAERCGVLERRADRAPHEQHTAEGKESKEGIAAAAPPISVPEALYGGGVTLRLVPNAEPDADAAQPVCASVQWDSEEDELAELILAQLKEFRPSWPLEAE